MLPLQERLEQFSRVRQLRVTAGFVCVLSIALIDVRGPARVLPRLLHLDSIQFLFYLNGLGLDETLVRIVIARVCIKIVHLPIARLYFDW